MKPLIVIAGCTASGKSDLAIKLAKQIGGYIINADSKQVYREFKIATSQPIPNKIKKDGKWIIDGIEHYLYGFVSIKSDYNIFKYQNDVKNILNKKEKDNQYPILVGGTGLYIDSIVYNYLLTQTNTSTTKNKINGYDRDYLSSLGIDELKTLIKEKLPNFNFEELNQSDRNNPRRLIRLIENSPIKATKGEILNHKYFVLHIEKEKLENNIKLRIEKMFEKGLLEEARAVYENYYLKISNSNQQDSKEAIKIKNSLNIIGFKELIPYFKKEKSLEEVKESIFIHTRQYAKRQRTWFKKNDATISIKDIADIYNVL